MLKRFLIFTIFSILIFIFVSGNWRLLYIRAQRDLTQWKAWKTTPGAKKEYPPQGIVRVKDRLLISEHYFDQASWVFEIEIASGKILRKFLMPSEATHTGGLSWDGVFLYAVDFNSNKVYQVDYEQSFQTENAVVKDSFSTGLNGSSACAWIPGEKPYLAISDFKNSRETILIDLNKSLIEKDASKNAVFRYSNEGFSQGLAYWNGFLFEVENKAFKSVVNIYSIKDIFEKDPKKIGVLKQFYLPGRGGQDIFIDDDNIWVSDAVKFQIFFGENDILSLIDKAD